MYISIKHCKDNNNYLELSSFILYSSIIMLPKLAILTKSDDMSDDEGFIVKVTKL